MVINVLNPELNTKCEINLLRTVTNLPEAPPFGKVAISYGDNEEDTASKLQVARIALAVVGLPHRLPNIGGGCR